MYAETSIHKKAEGLYTKLPKDQKLVHCRENAISQQNERYCSQLPTRILLSLIASYLTSLQNGAASYFISYYLSMKQVDVLL